MRTFLFILGLVFASLMGSGAERFPNVNALLHTNPVDYLAPSFVGPHGAVTAREGEQIIARLEEHQEVPSDILKRQIAFEQALSDVPLMLGNKVILLENGAQTYNAMLAAIRSAQSSINIQMFIFSDGQVGRTFAEALIDRQRHGVQGNLIPKDGGNRFNGFFSGSYTNDNITRSTNLDDALKAKGLTSVDAVDNVWDFDPAFGGRVE